MLLTGYSVEGTMAKHLQTDPTHIESKSGNRLVRRCRIDAVSFSAHCDFLQTSEFVDLVKPNHIVLVHGEKNQMARLQDALLRKYNQAEQAANKRRQLLASGAAGAAAGGAGAAGAAEGPLAPLWRPQAIHSPENCVTVEVAFPQQVSQLWVVFPRLQAVFVCDVLRLTKRFPTQNREKCACWGSWRRWCRASGEP